MSYGPDHQGIPSPSADSAEPEKSCPPRPQKSKRADDSLPPPRGQLLVVWTVRSLFLVMGRNFMVLLLVPLARQACPPPATQSFDPCPKVHPQPSSEGRGRQL